MKNQRPTTRRRQERKPSNAPSPGRRRRRSSASSSARTRTQRSDASGRTARRQRSPAGKTEHLQSHRRGRAINRSVSVVAGIFFIFVFVYLLRSFYAFLVTPNIPTQVVKIDSIDVPQIISGVIIRDEHVYTAEREGRVSFSVGDYERVKAGTTVCSIQNVQAVEDINKSMMSIEEQIIELQQMRQDISSVDPAVQRMNTQIKSIVDNKLHHFTVLNMSEVYSLKESISQHVNSRNRMILDENQNIKEDLNMQQQQLLNRLSNYSTVIKADSSGIVSPIVDGRENELNFESMKTLSKEQTLSTRENDQLIPHKEVQAEDAVFKLVSSNEWYIGAYMPNELMEGYEEGDVRTLYIATDDEYSPISVQVWQLDVGHRESFVLFRCTKNIIDYMDIRNINIKTTDSLRKGYKILNSAIVTRTFLMIPIDCLFEDGRYYVRKNAEDGETQVTVAVAEQDESYAYVLDDIANLRLGDELLRQSPIAAPYELAETLVVPGVYKVNNGYAEFRKITLDNDDLQTGGYSILTPSLNPGLKAYDNIITEASMVKDGQIMN